MSLTVSVPAKYIERHKVRREIPIFNEWGEEEPFKEEFMNVVYSAQIRKEGGRHNVFPFEDGKTYGTSICRGGELMPYVKRLD